MGAIRSASQSDLWKFAGAAFVVALSTGLFSRYLFRSQEWLSLAALELSGALLSGVVIFIGMKTLGDAHDRQRRARVVEPARQALDARLRVGLNRVYESVGFLADVDTTFDWYRPPSERLQRLRASIEDREPRIGPLTDEIQSGCPALSEAVTGTLSECAMLANVVDPDGELFSSLAALESAGRHEMRPLHEFSGRVPSCYQAWPDLRQHLLAVIDAAQRLAGGIGDALDEPVEPSSRRTSKVLPARGQKC